MTAEQQPRNKYIGIAVFTAASLGLYWFAKTKPIKPTLPIVYPPQYANPTGRVFQTVYTPQEFEFVLNSPESSKGTLFATFVRLGEPASNSMATNIWDIISHVKPAQPTSSNDNAVSTVCVELLGGRNDEIASKYIVNKVPSVVAFKKTLPSDSYYDVKVQNSDTDVDEIDKDKLQDWIHKVLGR